MNNLSVLAQNLEPMFTPNGFKEFLWACDKSGNDRHCYRAEKHARDWDKINGFLEPALSMTVSNYQKDLKAEEAIPSLMVFFRERLRAMNYPQKSTKGSEGAKR